jgi:hypothetical protein
LSVLGSVLLVTVYREILRFALPFVLVSVVAAGPLVDRLWRWNGRITAAMLSVAVMVPAGISALAPTAAMLGRVRDGAWTRSCFYEVPAMVDALPPGSRILNLGSAALTYPLMGAGGRNEVITEAQWRVLRGGTRSWGPLPHPGHGSSTSRAGGILAPGDTMVSIAILHENGPCQQGHGKVGRDIAWRREPEHQVDPDVRRRRTL